MRRDTRTVLPAFKAKWLLKLRPYMGDPDIREIVARLRILRTGRLMKMAETVIAAAEKAEGEKRRLLEEMAEDLLELAEEIV